MFKAKRAEHEVEEATAVRCVVTDYGRESLIAVIRGVTFRDFYVYHRIIVRAVVNIIRIVKNGFFRLCFRLGFGFCLRLGFGLSLRLGFGFGFGLSLRLGFGLGFGRRLRYDFAAAQISEQRNNVFIVYFAKCRNWLACARCF